MNEDLKAIRDDLEKVLERLADHVVNDDERSAPGDRMAAILHRFVQYQAGQLPWASDNYLKQAIEDVEEAWSLSDQLREDEHEELGKGAGHFLASLEAVSGAILPKFQDRSVVRKALAGYRLKIDSFIGETEGVPLWSKSAQRSSRLQRRNLEALEKAFFLRWQQPERFTINMDTVAEGKVCVFEHVAPQYEMEPKTLYNLYHKIYSGEFRRRVARRKRGK